ncbi:MAG: hypothetical protein KDA41_10520, partial [Planctomycetales bacterium]|nr:hypothetical protein [Planctomycetales bacterium]
MRDPRLRAPAGNGDVLFDPAPADLRRVLEDNHRAQSQFQDLSLHGRRLGDLAQAARRQLVAAAHEYTARYLDALPPRDGATDRIYLTGHQPELFHPGVWLKNFVVDTLARRDGGTAIHLLIDNDELRAASVAVPTVAADEPQTASVALDDFAGPCVWEERSIASPDLFNSFGRRATKAVAPLVPAPLIESMWRPNSAQHAG